MRALAVLLLLAALPAWAATALDFEADTPGQPPKGWKVASTGGGSPRWVVVDNEGGHALKQSGYAPFPLCVYEGATLQDGSASVRFKTLQGSEDQAAGIVWRYRNPDNYYVVRANALEDNVVLYKMQDGARTDLDVVGRSGGYGVDVKVPPKAWNTLQVDFAGPEFVVSLNGRRIFKVRDRTFQGPGRVGLWTKADSVTLFDDFRVSGG